MIVCHTMGATRVHIIMGATYHFMTLRLNHLP
jgi:hypothetical protein